MQQFTISVIGLGEVGTIISALLISDFNRINLNLIDIKTDISGRILDLEHAASVQNINVTVNNQKKLIQSDFIVFTAGFSNPKGKDRNTVVIHNKKIVELIFEGVKLKNNATIIVITNPVEIISQLISKTLNHKYLVIGTGTALDTFRFKYLLSEKFQIDITKVKALVLGEHGEYMIPIFSKCFVNNQSIMDLLTPKECHQLTTELKNTATTIRMTEQATKYGVSQIVMTIIKALNTNNSSVKIPISIMINDYYKKYLRTNDDIFISLPCEISKNKVNILAIDDLNVTELNGFSQAANALMTTYKSLKKV